MRRFLITAAIAIISYEIFFKVYLFATDVEKLDYIATSKSARLASEEIDSNIAIYRQIKLIEFFDDAEYFCVSGREVDPVALLMERGIESYNIDYSSFGFHGRFGWKSNRSYVSIVYRDKTAEIVELNIFDVNENHGGCSREMTLKFDDGTKEIFTFEGQKK